LHFKLNQLANQQSNYNLLILIKSDEKPSKVLSESCQKETKHTWLCCTNFWLWRTIFLALLHSPFDFAAQRYKSRRNDDITISTKAW